MAYNTTAVAELIQTTIHNSLTTPLEEASTFLGLGPLIVDSAAPVRFPTLAGTFAVGFVAEGAAIPVVDGPAFDDVPLMPSSMQALKVISKVTEEALRESSIALDSVLSSKIIADTQRALDAHIWSAAGDGINTPKGVFHADNVATYNVLGDGTAALDVDSLHDAVGTALGAEVPLGQLRWVMSSTSLTSLRKIKTNDGNYLVGTDVTQAGGYRMLGIPVQISNRLPAGKTMLISPKSFAVVRDLSPQVKVLTELYAGTGEVGLKMGSRWDIGVLDGAQNVVIDHA